MLGTRTTRLGTAADKHAIQGMHRDAPQPLDSTWIISRSKSHWYNNRGQVTRASVPVLRAGGDPASLELAMLRWWLLPSWSKSYEIKYSTFNAKSEDSASKPAFRGPFKRR